MCKRKDGHEPGEKTDGLDIFKVTSFAQTLLETINILRHTDLYTDLFKGTRIAHVKKIKNM